MRRAFNPMSILIDAHQDLAWNIINLGRDYSLSADKTRELEKDTPIPAFNGNTLLGWPQYQQAKSAIIFGTLFSTPRRLDKEKYATKVYTTTDEAHQQYRENLDAYLNLSEKHPDKFRLIFNQLDLTEHMQLWQEADHAPTNLSQQPPVGILILMEGAEGIRRPAEVESWFNWGVRMIGLAWASNRFCGGTREPGPLTNEGQELLEHMADFGMILDISHMDQIAARQVLDMYQGQVIATHANVEQLLKRVVNNRHLNDKIITQLIEREGVIGIIPFNNFLDPNWKNRGGRQVVSLEDVIAHIDHICQLAGSARHVGIGSDFDGGFGVEMVPYEIDTIADIPKLIPLLTKKGYNHEDIELIFHGNWLRILANNLPPS